MTPCSEIMLLLYRPFITMRYMRVWGWYLDPVMTCRLHHAINGGGADKCDEFDFCGFEKVSSLITPCSEIMLLLYGPFITCAICACGDGIYIR